MITSTRQPYCRMLARPPCVCMSVPLAKAVSSNNRLPYQVRQRQLEVIRQFHDRLLYSILFWHDSFSFPIGAEFCTLGFDRGKVPGCFFRTQGLRKARGLRAEVLLFLFLQRFQEGLGFFRGSFRQVHGKAHPK